VKSKTVAGRRSSLLPVSPANRFKILFMTVREGEYTLEKKEGALNTETYLPLGFVSKNSIFALRIAATILSCSLFEALIVNAKVVND
jgi:hypothetical protein